MTELKYNAEWIDRYLRDELSEDEIAEFELALFESPELQNELEATMALRHVVHATEQDMEEQTSEQISPITGLDGRNGWNRFAMAASVLLAVFSTTMYWKVSNEAGDLQSQIEALKQPRSNVITIPVDIMRSTNNQTPDAIIQKPDGDALIVLEIELSPDIIESDEVLMLLRDADNRVLFEWPSENFDDGYASVALENISLPEGLVRLEILDKKRELLDSRLLEFSSGLK